MKTAGEESFHCVCGETIEVSKKTKQARALFGCHQNVQLNNTTLFETKITLRSIKLQI